MNHIKKKTARRKNIKHLLTSKRKTDMSFCTAKFFVIWWRKWERWVSFSNKALSFTSSQTIWEELKHEFLYFYSVRYLEYLNLLKNWLNFLLQTNDIYKLKFFWGIQCFRVSGILKNYGLIWYLNTLNLKFWGKTAVLFSSRIRRHLYLKGCCEGRNRNEIMLITHWLTTLTMSWILEKIEQI